MKNLRIKSFVCLMLTLTITCQSLGQIWSLYPYNFVVDEERTQKALLHFATIGTYETHTRVRGIAFTQTASLSDEIKDISISYDPTQPNGSRFSVLINDSIGFSPVIFDWQLVPIAHFANDNNYNSVLDIDGDGQIYYHPSIIDQILGIRAVQADEIPSMAYMASKANAPPSLARDLSESASGFMKYNDQEITAIGEEKLAKRLRDRAEESLKELGKIIINKAAEYSMLCDYQVEIIASVKNGEFKLSGDPYYLFTTVNDKTKSVKINWPVKASERRISSKHLKEINPYVFQSMKTLSNYSALFRYFKDISPSDWSGFLESLPSSSSIYPQVVTPDVEN